MAEILETWGMKEPEVSAAVSSISSDPDRWVDFMMKYELGLEEPDPKRARNSSLTIGFSYILGGLIPLSPYIFAPTPTAGLIISVLVTLVALFIFGFIKGKFTGTKPVKSAWQTMLVGGLAAGIAFLIAKLIS